MQINLSNYKKTKNQNLSVQKLSEIFASKNPCLKRQWFRLRYKEIKPQGTKKPQHNVPPSRNRNIEHELFKKQIIEKYNSLGLSIQKEKKLKFPVFDTSSISGVVDFIVPKANHTLIIEVKSCELKPSHEVQLLIYMFLQKKQSSKPLKGLLSSPKTDTYRSYAENDLTQSFEAKLINLSKKLLSPTIPIPHVSSNCGYCPLNTVCVEYKKACLSARQDNVGDTHHRVDEEHHFFTAPKNLPCHVHRSQLKPSAPLSSHSAEAGGFLLWFSVSLNQSLRLIAC